MLHKKSDNNIKKREDHNHSNKFYRRIIKNEYNLNHKDKWVKNKTNNNKMKNQHPTMMKNKRNKTKEKINNRIISNNSNKMLNNNYRIKWSLWVNDKSSRAVKISQEDKKVIVCAVLKNLKIEWRYLWKITTEKFKVIQILLLV